MKPMATTTLDVQEQENGKQNSGRPRIFDEPVVRKTAYLPEEVWLFLTEIGDDNFSKGVRRAAEALRRQSNGSKDGG